MCCLDKEGGAPGARGSSRVTFNGSSYGKEPGFERSWVFLQ